ncbi:succinylglutamate desuccinylase [Vibrio sp. MACH09]|uniref:succinylglutamate desuccinylase n=1 Tax=Vibrio sp. MACH09 TaxID=3025122 RepID=UPI002792739F|nr:succinylglutamate desuccinylase [Vibrio sp. MACH09]GLO60864.1 succinylglutamate desuccinylase [Vibrio sp. MACH09]
MVKPLFRHSFLYDTLDLENEMPARQLELVSGASVKVVKRGVIEVIPYSLSNETKSIVISAGIHGDETAPMEMVDHIVTSVLDGSFKITERCLFILGHPLATNQHVRFLDENLNRLFDDKQHSKSVENDIADELKSVVREFFKNSDEAQRWHLDLHCAIRRSKHYTFAVSPKVTNQKTRRKDLIEFMQKAKVEAILLSNSPASTFSWFSAENFAAQALTLELGKVAPLGENDLTVIEDFNQALKGLLSNSLQFLASSQLTPYRVTQTIKRLHEDFDFNFNDDVENFTQFEHGQVLGHDGDKLLFAKVDHEAVVFPNKNVAVGQRAALMVSPVETRYEDDQLVYD